VTRFLAALARVVARAVTRIDVRFESDLPHEGPLIVVANHLSNADPPLVYGWLTPKLGRRLHILAKEALFVGPLGWFLRTQGITPVRAGGSDMEAYRAAKAVLDRDDVLCIFPEGTRSASGALQEPRPGVAMLATRSGVPVLPVGISGTDRFLGRGQRFPRFGSRISVRVGRTFTLELDPELSRREAMNKASDDLMRQIAALVDERHRGRFG
jgi:1-acyl-sn-glycerol-3-phosphate acyltransferase